MALGDITAIHDWMGTTWYNKEEINDIIISHNAPLYDIYSPYYSNEAGSVCTAWYQSCTKTADGDSYNGVLYAYNGGYSSWVAFCLSLSEATAKAMSYRYTRSDGIITYNGRIWYYSTDMAQGASGQNRDNTDPASRRFYYREGALNIPEWLRGLLDTMNTH